MSGGIRDQGRIDGLIFEDLQPEEHGMIASRTGREDSAKDNG
jgi:hypothetical protein